MERDTITPTRPGIVVPFPWTASSHRYKSTAVLPKRKQPSILLRKLPSERSAKSLRTTSQPASPVSPPSSLPTSQPKIARHNTTTALRAATTFASTTSASTSTIDASSLPAPNAAIVSPSSLNAFAVSTLSANAHPPRPAPQIKDGRLPDGYKAAARRVTLTMVALPIAIVTSYVLWQRC